MFQEIVITTSFASLGLSAELLRAVAEQGYTEPTPIQAQAIPVVLSGRDLLGAAQTGTGKTAGFALPLLQKLAAGANTSASPARHPVRVLVLVPTRELAAQVQDSFRAYGRHVKLRSTVIFGGVGFNPQATELRRGVDIVVATPGRLLDHVEQRTIDLRQVEVLVLDEADRMLDMGFIPAIRRILALLPAQRQNLLFSATFPDEIRKLAGSFMRDPVTVE
ncbi:MAG: DEAD/DEAH box helicase, partial [Burkholderiales bacterium]